MINRLTRQQIVDNLRLGVIMVTFTKTDGTQRIMRCTLNDDYIPPKQTLIETTPRAIHPDQINVWDIEANAWRSFNINTVSKVELI